MCSPDELQKLLSDDKLFKQYVILQLSGLNKKIEEYNNFNCRLKDVENRLDKIEKDIIKINEDINFIKKFIAGVGAILVSVITYLIQNIIR